MINTKHTLRVLDSAPEMQAVVTNQALLFAQLTFEAAKKNSLSRKQVIKDLSTRHSK